MRDSQIFDELLSKYGSHSAVAEELDVSYRTYLDWRKRADEGTTHTQQWKVIKCYLLHVLKHGKFENNHSTESSQASSGRI